MFLFTRFIRLFTRYGSSCCAICNEYSRKSSGLSRHFLLGQSALCIHAVKVQKNCLNFFSKSFGIKWLHGKKRAYECSPGRTYAAQISRLISHDLSSFGIRFLTNTTRILSEEKIYDWLGISINE